MNIDGAKRLIGHGKRVASFGLIATHIYTSGTNPPIDLRSQRTTWARVQSQKERDKVSRELASRTRRTNAPSAALIIKDIRKRIK